MSYIYSAGEACTEYDALSDLALRIKADFPRLRNSTLELIKEILWDLSPGDLFEHTDLGISVYARY